jgi:hypothetical protein
MNTLNRLYGHVQVWAASGLVSASHQARSLSSHPSSIQHALTPRTARARGRAVRIPARGTEKDMQSLSIPAGSRQPVSVPVVGHHARCRAQIPPMRAARTTTTPRAGERHPARRNNAAPAPAAGALERFFTGWPPPCSLMGSWHVEPVAALAPPRLRVVFGGDRHARRHGHVHRVARAAVAALGRAPWRV